MMVRMGDGRKPGRGLRVALLLAALLATAAGCGGSEDDVTTPNDVTERAGELLGVGADDVDLQVVATLEPSSCQLQAASSSEELTSRARYLVALPDGSVVDDGQDDAALTVLQACFTDGDGDDRTLTGRPGAESFARLMVTMGDTSGPLVLADPAVAPRLLEPFGVEYHDPILTETDDGATVTFFAENPERGAIVRLDVTWRATGLLSIDSTSW